MTRAAPASGRRAVVHIGAPRTGTTTLQFLLDRHREPLEDAGILYPRLTPASAARPHLNHQHLGETLDGRRPRADRRELLDDLDRMLATTAADVVILSYERLCLVPRWRRAPQALAAAFRRRGFAMEVLYTVRPQAGAIQSQYAWRCQFLRETRSLRDSFDRSLRDPRLDPALGLRPWLAAAEARHTVVPLRDVRSSAPLVLRVAAALGLDGRMGALLSAHDLAQVENGSLNATAIEAARRLSRSGMAPRDNAEARRVVDFVAREMTLRGLDGPPFRGLDAEMMARAETRFARVNDRFARQAWGEPWSARVAPDPRGPVTEIAGRPDALSPEAEAALNAIVASALHRFAPRRSTWLRALTRALARPERRSGR